MAAMSRTFKSVVAALTCMRHNRTQAEIGESLGVSQSTISRAISVITPLIPEAVREFVPTADDLDPDAQYILDGTHRRELGVSATTTAPPGCGLPALASLPGPTQWWRG